MKQKLPAVFPFFLSGETLLALQPRQPTLLTSLMKLFLCTEPPFFSKISRPKAPRIRWLYIWPCLSKSVYLRSVAKPTVTKRWRRLFALSTSKKRSHQAPTPSSSWDSLVKSQHLRLAVRKTNIRNTFSKSKKSALLDWWQSSTTTTPWTSNFGFNSVRNHSLDSASMISCD